MKKVTIETMVEGDYYLVKCPNFSESEWEIAIWDDNMLISQANSEDIMSYAEKIYTLPL